MQFRSNNCIAIHVTDLEKAERFYGSIMGFRLLNKTASQLEYDTGHFLLYINKDEANQLPIPSFSTGNCAEAKTLLRANGCEILVDRGNSIYFKDPFGMVYDVIQE